MLSEAARCESGRKMRIMLTDAMRDRLKKGERLVTVDSIPWEIIAGDICERASQQNHGQSLSRISERGGFCATEALCVLTSMKWRQGENITEEQAHRILYMMTALYRRGVLAAGKALDTLEQGGGERE